MKRWSVFVIPISIVAHLAIINIILFLFVPNLYLHGTNFAYFNIAWLAIAYFMNFYPTDRKENFWTNFNQLLHLFAIFGLTYFASFTFSGFTPSASSLFYYVVVYLFICTTITGYRALFYWGRKKYRIGGGNFVNVVVIGKDKNLKKLEETFAQPDLGYRFKGFFNKKPSKKSSYLGSIEDAYEYLITNKIDQIYCTASKLSKKELKQLISFADNNLIKLKIIPDNKEMFSSAMSFEMYDSVPVISMRTSLLDRDFSLAAKRIFDVVFSSVVIVFVLSWLIPLMYVLIKLESKGPLFFKQQRHGVNRKSFWCYKFRSMKKNKDADTVMASKNDMRVTRIGKFIRKTSIDELPQFINVFLGDMSVVGPRPHMQFHTEKYQSSVDKYLVRHFIKPGITGLAQIRGYRGEIEKRSDIVNRVRLDIFYFEKWSLAFDIKIIYNTITSVFSQRGNAY